MADKTPVTILTGFLGAGKTTLLNHILNGNHGLRVAVLVNDFGAVNIDARLVVGVEGETVSLSNGCICCTIRGDLLNCVDNLLKRPDTPEYILIEASGVSDPAQIALTFTKSHLRDVVRIDSILTVVDAEQFESLTGQERTLANDQLQVADIVILNKIDLVSDDERERLKRRIHRWVPQARILETTHANVPLELLLGVGEYDPERFLNANGQDIHVHPAGDDSHDHEHNHSLVFSTWHWSSAEPVALQSLYRALEEIPLSIFRVKGMVYAREVPDKRCVLQVVGKRMTLSQGQPWGDEMPQNLLVMIGAHGSIDAAELQRRFDACLVSNESQADIVQFVNGVLKWLRIRR
jgi:G3E family GTPase